ncbi:MAG: FimV/HubP family polar landmark protein [Mariprofundus sp.]|nr:FimV/HubP family polar landmark protein [Mariprofundus sp.]
MKGQIRHNGGWRSWRNAAVACLSTAFLLFSSNAQAASLEKIEVASAIGQPLYAEVPLLLEGNELASKVFIEIASAADYKIFEVYRDPILNSIRADVASDERGARVKLTSRTGIKTPFFNLVLKVRYGRVSHFKKYSVFLDSAKSIERIAAKDPLPQVHAAKAIALGTAEGASTPPIKSKLTESAGNALITKQTKDHAKQQAELQTEVIQNAPVIADSWARTDKYGPIVRGDSLSIIAKRLRTDARYSNNQVMVALFERNKSSFEKDNINLIKAGSYLLTPSGLEVEKLDRSEANRVVADQEAAWKMQPKYPAEAEAQRNRYTNRVSFGEQAEGEALAVKPVEATQDLLKPQKKDAPAIVSPSTIKTAAPAQSEGVTTPNIEQFIQVQSETNQLLLALQQKNEALQTQLLANKTSVDGLKAKVDEGSSAASDARIAKLEILLTRLQAQLENQVKPAAVTQTNSTSEWITWLLLSLVIVMLGIIAMRMRKEPVHPASDQQLSEPITEQTSNDESFDEVVEEAVDSIETDESKRMDANTTASMASFSDELSDTDTAELEAFDVNASPEVDPNVDYLSEADVYIRYGMDDEALQQLDLALRVNPANTEAHVKKAEILHGKHDQSGFAAAVSAASVALAGVELKQYKAVVESFGGALEAPSAASVAVPEVATEPMVETTEIESALTIAIDDTEIDGLDFDLGGLGMAGAEQVKANADNNHVDANLEATNELNWLSDPAFDDEKDIEGEPDLSMGFETDGDAKEEAQDFAFETVDEQGVDVSDASDFESEDVSPVNANDSTDLSDTIVLGATQELGSLFSEFNEPDSVIAASSDTDKKPLLEAADEIGLSDTQELGNLLSEFTEQDEAESIQPGADAEKGETDHSATQHLDSLLGEFSDDGEDLSFSSLEDDFDMAAVIEEGKAAPASGVELGLDIDHCATQELDGLLSEFTDDDDDLGVSFIDPAESPEASQSDSPDNDVEFGSTQELDSLLGEFSNKEGSNVSKPDDNHSATQVLGHLLDEFNFDDDGDDKKS